MIKERIRRLFPGGMIVLGSYILTKGRNILRNTDHIRYIIGNVHYPQILQI